MWLGVLSELGMEGAETEFKPHECRHSAKQVTRSMWWRAAEVVIMKLSAGSAGDTSVNDVPIGTESSAIGTPLTSTPGCAGIIGTPHADPDTFIRQCRQQLAFNYLHLPAVPASRTHMMTNNATAVPASLDRKSVV